MDVFDDGLIGEQAGAPLADDNHGLDEGAHDDEQNAVFEQEYAAANASREVPYNLRTRVPTGNQNSQLQAAMDAPFDTKSYHPPRQLLQTDRDRLKHVSHT